MNPDETRRHFRSALHSVAYWLEEHPDLRVSNIEMAEDGHAVITCFSYHTKEDVRELLTHWGPGRVDKHYGQNLLTLTLTPSDEVSVQAFMQRDNVCTARVVGTETLHVEAVEASPARTVERDIVEWDCVPLLDRTAIERPSRDINIDTSDEDNPFAEEDSPF